MRNMPGRRLPVVYLYLAVGFAGTAGAAAPQESEAARWIARLGSTSFRQRDEATEALEDLGEEAREALQEAEKESTDPEVLRRVRSLLGALEGRTVTAKAFADRVLPVLELLEQDAAAAPGWDLLIETTLGGLYRADDKDLRADLARRLRAKPPRSSDEAHAILRDGYRQLLRRRALALTESTDRALRNVLAELDPHAVLQEEDFGCRLLAPWFGVGLRLRVLPEGKIGVVTALKDSPARRAGIRPDDVLTCITMYTDRDGSPLLAPRVLSTEGASLEEANTMLLGPEGTHVELTVSRRGLSRLLTFDVARGRVLPETILGWKRRQDDHWDYWIDQNKKLAYVRIPRFIRGVEKDMEQVVRDLLGQGMKGLLLDLRGNPGGLHQAALDTAELFVGARPLVTFRPRVGRPTLFEGHENRLLPPFALVCLIDADTTGSAEFLTACIQDYRRGLVIGQRSHGKGSVQQVQRIDDRQALVFTTAVFYRPSGKKLDRIRMPGRPADEWGVTPDVAWVLKPHEREELKAHLERAEMVVGDPAIWEDLRGGFRDPQRDLGLLLVRGLAACRLCTAPLPK